MDLQEKRRHVLGEMKFLSLDAAALIPSPDDLEEDVERRVDVELVLGALETVPVRDERVVKMYFGIDEIDEEQISLSEISRRLCISRYDAKKFLTRALKRVRYSLEECCWRA